MKSNLFASLAAQRTPALTHAHCHISDTKIKATELRTLKMESIRFATCVSCERHVSHHVVITWRVSIACNANIEGNRA